MSNWNILWAFIAIALLTFYAYSVVIHDPSPGGCDWDGEVCEENYDALIEEENLVR